MIGLKRALACGALLLSSSFSAHAAETTNIFAVVTGIHDDGTNLSLTGVLVNTTTPTTVPLGIVPDRCAKLSFAMLSNPETYKLTVVTETETNTVTGATVTIFINCRLDLSPRTPRGER
jgi:hypothetical protein